MPGPTIGREDDAWIPRPDPTKLTTEQLNREISALKSLFDAKFDARDEALETLRSASEARLKEGLRAVQHAEDVRNEKFNTAQAERRVIEQRLSDMDRALELGRSTIDRHTDIALNQAHQLFEEKMRGLEFKIRDMDVAQKAALQATKEQAGERQSSVNKSIDQLSELMKTTVGALGSKFDDMRDRVTAIESHSKGGGDVIVWIFGGIATLWAIISTIALMMHLGGH